MCPLLRPSLGLVPVLVLVLAASTAAATRTTVGFDYGWRFHLLDPAGESPDYSWQRNLTNSTHCEGLVYVDSGRQFEHDCSLECLFRPNCFAWQFYKENWSYVSPGGCYISVGKDYSCTDTGKAITTPLLLLAGGERDAFTPLPAFDFSSPDFADSAWPVVDVPHDFVINGTYTIDEDNNHGNLPRGVGWYRKHFTLPTEWAGSKVAIHFEGVMHMSDIWFNGLHLGQYTSGYTGFTVDLPAAAAVFGASASASVSASANASASGHGSKGNVLAVRADARFGGGHWYEGGGLYRSVRLVRTPLVHARVADAVHAPPEGTGRGFAPSVTVVNDSDDPSLVSATFAVVAGNTSTVVATGVAAPTAVPAGASATVSAAAFDVPARAWGIRTPVVYTVAVSVFVGGALVDSVNTTVGFRTAVWDTAGFHLNGDRIQLRGFCHHEDFTGVGVAVPDRINLFRAQKARSIGANSWRMSHNPYRPKMYDILDNLGLVVWDENRDYEPWTTQDMSTMVRRDRSHPSVVIWSFCNEVECHQMPDDNTTQFAFRAAAKALDTSRPVSFNYAASTEAINLATDVHGFSHQQPAVFEKDRQYHPDTPLVSSECCSTETQRIDAPMSGEQLKIQVGGQDGMDYVAGNMGVWTLFDYYGEPLGWPKISSSFGQFDLAGFAKPNAYWFRAWWLCNAANSPLDSPGRNTAEGCDSVKIVEQWDPAFPATTVNVFSSVNGTVSLVLNGKHVGTQPVTAYGYAAFTGVSYEAGELVAIASDQAGKAVANHTLRSAGGVAKLAAFLQVPSEATGTGSVLVADGHDAAVVGVRILDADGTLVPTANNTVSFRVVSGPGRVVGVGNGDPASHEYNQAPHRSAYGGLATVVVRVTLDCTSPAVRAGLVGSIDRDAGPTTVAAACPASVPDIVVEASVDGVAASTVNIPVSTDAVGDSPVAVAARTKARLIPLTI